LFSCLSTKNPSIGSRRRKNKLICNKITFN
jgi:hypothetical protein